MSDIVEIGRKCRQHAGLRTDWHAKRAGVRAGLQWMLVVLRRALYVIYEINHLTVCLCHVECQDKHKFLWMNAPRARGMPFRIFIVPQTRNVYDESTVTCSTRNSKYEFALTQFIPVRMLVECWFYFRTRVREDCTYFSRSALQLLPRITMQDSNL